MGLASVELNNAELLLFNISLPIMSFVGFITNFIVILAIVHDRELRKISSNLFVLNLACADIFVLSVGVPLWIVQLVVAPKTDSIILCQFTYGLSVMSSLLSIFTLGMISYDRYLAVTKPFKYHRIMTKQRSQVMIIMLWLICIISSIPAFVGWHSIGFQTNSINKKDITAYCVYTRIYREEYLYMTYSGVLIVIIMNIGIYSKLLSVARTHARRIRTVEHELESNSTIPGIVQRKEKNFKAAKTLGVVLGVLIVCWLPFLAVAYVDTAKPQWGISIFTVKLLGTITYVNSIMNPIIYTYMSRDFQRAVRKVLRKTSSADSDA